MRSCIGSSRTPDSVDRDARRRRRIIHRSRDRIDRFFAIGDLIRDGDACDAFGRRAGVAGGDADAGSSRGRARAARGAVRVRYGAADETLSYASVFGAPDADGWTYVSAILREDFGWAFEPNGTMPSAAEMKAALALASAVEIRGDAYVYGAAGSGQEVVYLNDVQLYAPARRPGAYWR